ncbi:unnamed protein product [Miscanthus lutarioriparius]|uniref:F-box domain-containing protein n=1 Tax=Miscanthus lutarioriparius TaxID=422564 RepID=A0A811RFZ6_9POAL|nr:unnamed protein product [Miscanthus lutarioriparius]
MGLVDLMQHMSMERQPDRLRRRAETTYGLVASRDNNEVSPCQQEADSQGGEAQIPRLPEDIWCHIHSLMPMRSAARAACVSRAFLRSWRCHPNLTFSVKALRSNKKEYENDDIARDFCSKVDQILKRHSGVGVKKLNIQMLGGYNGYVDSWLQIAVRSGIEELSLSMPRRAKYNVPCSLFSNGSGDSIQYLYLTGCSFRPKTELGCLRSLTKLHLYYVSFTGDELGCLLSNSFALEGLGISFCYEGDRIQLSLGETLQMKELSLSFSLAQFIAFVLNFRPACQTLKLPLYIQEVSQLKMEHVSIFADPSDLRKMQGQQHHKMKTVEIIGFTSAKSLVELTCHIVESVTSLECLTLRTHQSSSRCSESANANKSNKCSPLPVHVLMEAQRALLAIRTYIEPKVPSMCIIISDKMFISASLWVRMTAIHQKRMTKLAAKGVNFGQKILYILIAVASLLGTTLFFIQKKVAKKSVIGTSFSEKFMLFTAWDMYWFACMHKLTISS